MSDVFISYSQKDSVYAEHLYQFLSFNQIRAWYAPYKVEVGNDFAEDISNALASNDRLEIQEDITKHSEHLKSCQLVILLLSGNAMSSPWVKKEIKYSIKLEKTIFPIQIDHHKLTDEYAFLLSDVQIISAYHLNKEALLHISTVIRSLLRDSGREQDAIIYSAETFEPLLYSDLNIDRVAFGDPYYQEGHTLYIRLSNHEFFLSPPYENLTDQQKEWVYQHFARKESCFESSLEKFSGQIAVSDLINRIHSSKAKVLRDFLYQENGCYFNNQKYGVEKIYPFGRSEDISETPELRIDLYTTDYYTHRVMKDVCKTLIQEQGEEFLSQIRYTNLGPYKIFFTSLGINLLLTDKDKRGNQSLLLTTRSLNATETYGKSHFSLSVIEGVSVSDYDSYEKTVRLENTVIRGLKEELGVSDHMIHKETIRFYELFANKANLELGLSASAELKSGFSLERDVLPLRGKDDAIEVAGKEIVSMYGFDRFLLRNRNCFLPQATYAAASYLESMDIHVFSRYISDFSKEQSFIMNKNGHDTVCGDAIVDCKYYIAVIDGATPKGEMLWDGDPGDVYIARLLADAVRSMPYDFTATSAIEYLNSEIQNCYIQMRRENIPQEERLQASVVIFSACRKEIWNFGDCKFRINQINYDNNKKVDVLLSNLRAFCLEVQKQLCKESGSAYDPSLGRQEILPFLKKQSILANKEWSFSYDVLDGGKIHPEHVSIEPVKKGDHVVLASDGYPVLYDSLEETENYLRKNLQKDVDCIYQLRGTKGITIGNYSFDDRCYISFIVK